MTIQELQITGWKDQFGHLWNPPEESNWIEYDPKSFRSGRMMWFIPAWFINADKDIWTRSVITTLQLYNRTGEEYYARFFLNLSEVPTCANPGCTNKVHLAEGKVSHGFYECCCRSCGISKADITRWKDPNYALNQQEFKTKKSLEMTNNLKIWNADPEFQSKSKRGKILAKDADYVFYIALTKSGFLKFGLYQSGSRQYRLYVQEEYNKDPYVLMHDLYVGHSSIMADFEYELKSRLGHKEYLNNSQFSELKSIIRELKVKYL